MVAMVLIIDVKSKSWIDFNNYIILNNIDDKVNMNVNMN